MSDRGSDPTEPIEGFPEPPARRASSHVVGNVIAILLVLAVGGMMAFGAVRSFVPAVGGAVASPSPSLTVAPSPSITLRPLPSFTATPSRSPSPSPTPTRTASPTPRVTPTPPRTPTPLPTRTPPRTPTPAPTRTP